ncbi:hypothetical protein Nepgr_000365 [Nepenthes gracilis]|uniref:Myb/SANT-like DNA-binding domain-containing protein n=1 Tax=Nepenthes gracilis TaxID=150966 RepID=A0AAD3P2Z5_NEPGR|nr:hypothetical protein Nepgr_000365 [Nepenthes gracilis]
MDNGEETPLPSIRPPLIQAPPSGPTPVREDCWSEEATHTLIEAWGDRYLELHRGNLRQKHWQEVADAVNALHGHTKKTRRTDIQCKNRIDTIKKKYKIEKARDVESRGAYVSPWPFFARLDALIGDPMKNISPPAPRLLPHRKTPPSEASPSLSPSPAFALTSPIPVGPRSAKPKRTAAVNDSFFRRNVSAVAAAAAAAAPTSGDEEAEDQESEASRSRSSGSGSRRRQRESDGYRQLAEAIRRFGEIYERVEVMKQEQLIELEKHRMQFAKDLEYQRMKLLMDSQLRPSKSKRAKPSDDAESFL